MPHSLKSVLLLGALTLACTSAGAQTRIGLAVPGGETAPLLEAQMRAGALAAIDAVDGELIIEPDACTSEGGSAAARRFVDDGVSAVVGFLCTEAIEAALPILTEAGIPVIATGIRTDSLTDRRERTGWQVFRLGPRADAERDAAARYVIDTWRGSLFAIVDDGTIYGREIAETVRIAAEESGLVPVFVDTFRPQLDNQIGLVGRLRRSGATHVFVGGDREDIAIMARDAAGLGYALTIAGGEALRAAGETPLVEGIVMIAATQWEDAVAPDAEKPAEEQGYFLPVHAAVEIAVAASENDEAIGDGRFETIIGPVEFDAKSDLEGQVYRSYRFDGSSFVPVD